MRSTPPRLARTAALAAVLLAPALAGRADAQDAPGRPAAATGSIEVTGGLAAASTWLESDVPFWIRIHNQTDSPLTTLRFQAVGGDVRITSICTPTRESPARPVCTQDAPVDVAAHTDRVFNGTLRLGDGGEHHIAILAIDGSHELTVALGTLTGKGVGWAVTALKDVALWPVLLGVVGYFYKEWSSRQKEERVAAQEAEQRREAAAREEREKAREADERRLAAASEEAQRRIQERSTTVRVMLPIVHEYAVRYYSVIANAARQFYRRAEGYTPAPDSEPDAAAADLTFFYLQLQLKNREFGQRVGGFYLATLVAEQILIRALRRWDTALFPPEEEAANRAVTVVLDALQTRRTAPAATVEEEALERASRILNRFKLEAFLATADQPVQDACALLRDRLIRWAGATPCLSDVWLYGEVMARETDLLFELWYGSGEVPSLVIPAEHEAVCRGICADLEASEARGLQYLGLKPASAGST